MFAAIGLAVLSGLGCRYTHPGRWIHLPFRGHWPYRLRSNNGSCSRTNDWQLSIYPRRRIPAFIPHGIKASLCVGRPVPSPDAPTPVATSSPPPANQIIPLIMPQTTHSTTPSPSPSSPILVPNHAPQRCSRRLANQAELAGGRKVYSHTQAPCIPLR